MILVDTSAWIEYDHESGSAAHRRLRDLITAETPIATTEPVVMEYLAGTRTTLQRAVARSVMASVERLPFDSAVDFDLASTFYRSCRARGVTPRGLVDCMIAAVAFRNGASVLAHDVDLARICEAVGVELDEASLR